jgi:hypothetical protein
MSECRDQSSAISAAGTNSGTLLLFSSSTGFSDRKSHGYFQKIHLLYLLFNAADVLPVFLVF